MVSRNGAASSRLSTFKVKCDFETTAVTGLTIDRLCCVSAAFEQNTGSGRALYEKSQEA